MMYTNSLLQGCQNLELKELVNEMDGDPFNKATAFRHLSECTAAAKSVLASVSIIRNEPDNRRVHELQTTRQR